MALSRLLLVITALFVLAPFTSQAQFEDFEPTTAKQDGIIILDALGRFFSAPLQDGNVGTFLIDELSDNSQSFGFPFPVVRDLETVARPDGSLKGAYMIDIFGGQFSLNIVTGAQEVTSPIPTPFELGQNNERFSSPPFWGFDVVEDLEIAQDWREVTHGFKGYFVLDADGAVHPLGETNLPQYAMFTDPNSTNIEDATIVPQLFPSTIDISGTSFDAASFLQNGPINAPVNRPFTSNQVNSATPVFVYFGLGSDIARDLEASADFAELTAPARDPETGELDFNAVQNRRIAMTNGYYILDGFGVVHSSRLPLDFDVNNDGRIDMFDLFKDPNSGTGELNPDFGAPINNAPISEPWLNERENLPFFGTDAAVDIEITPSGRGFYLLDKFGGVFAVGDATFSFPPRMDENGNVVSTAGPTPYFGFPIARDLAITTNAANPSLGVEDNRVPTGLAVIDGFGTVHTTGLSQTFAVSKTGNQGESVTTFSDVFRAVETSPKWIPRAPQVRNFSIGDDDLPVSAAPGFRNVTAAFKTISAPQEMTAPQPNN